MPGMNGAALAARIRDDPATRDTVVVMLTSVSYVSDAQDGVQCDAYLVKPVRQSVLLRTLATARARRRGTSVAGEPSRPGLGAKRIVASAPGGRPFRVLVAEDNIVNQRVAVRMPQKVRCHPRDPQTRSTRPRDSDHCHDRRSHVGYPGTLPGCRHGRLHRQARETRRLLRNPDPVTTRRRACGPTKRPSPVCSLSGRLGPARQVCRWGTSRRSRFVHRTGNLSPAASPSRGGSAAKANHTKSLKLNGFEFWLTSDTLAAMTTDRGLLEAALLGYKQQLTETDAKMAEIRLLLEGAPMPAPAKKRKISAAGRRRMAEAQRKRWAAQNSPDGPPAKKRHMSAAGRKRIAEAAKKRWAAFRAQRAI
jgi:hypothetical protein